MAITVTTPPTTGVEFIAAPGLDLVNAMYFTSIADRLEGLDGWPAETRQRMDPALRGELDLLFSYPRGEPGVMGALNDALFFHPDAWSDVDALLRFIRELPATGTEDPLHPGIQGLALYALRWPGHQGVYQLPPGVAPRDAIASRVSDKMDVDFECIAPQEGDGDASVALTLFDDPEGVRARILHVVRRFYDEHYRPDEARRAACMKRSVDAHAGERGANLDELTRRLTGRPESCIATVCKGPHERYLFVPSVDVGIYTSCIDYGPLHALYYQCEAQFRGVPDEDELTKRMALVYRALGDEQRLRILRLLGDGELYAQEVVERTGLHQSVVSRHLSFLRATGLVVARRQNNMKFFSLNREAGEELRHALDVFLPDVGARSGYQAAQRSS